MSTWELQRRWETVRYLVYYLVENLVPPELIPGADIIDFSVGLGDLSAHMAGHAPRSLIATSPEAADPPPHLPTNATHLEDVPADQIAARLPAASACSGNCVVSSSLPKDAANHLPPGALQTLYVQVRDSDGNPSNDTYTVCLANPNRTLVTLYRFVSGAWVPLAISTSDPVCATVTGDGAFYLAPTLSLAISQI